jgi:hypothetical protein
VTTELHIRGYVVKTFNNHTNLEMKNTMRRTPHLTEEKNVIVPTTNAAIAPETLKLFFNHPPPDMTSASSTAFDNDVDIVLNEIHINNTNTTKTGTHSTRCKS